MMGVVMTADKRQDLPPGLWVVATPIGNLDDLSPRVGKALALCDVVLAEDTRRTQALLSALGIRARVERLDAHAGAAEVRRWVRRLAEGQSAALVTDAGTPGISDPGAALVVAARGEGVRVTVVPGPSAVTAALSLAGFAEPEFSFRGYFPRKAGDRADELEKVELGGRIAVWFESPKRVAGALQAIAEAKPQADLFAAKELTKIHERTFSGTSPVVASAVAEEIQREGAVGEWVLVARFSAKAVGARASDDAWKGALRCLIDAQVSAPEAARRVSQVFGAPRNEAYRMALEWAGKKSSSGG